MLHAQPAGYGFAQSAVRALKLARDKPATRNGEPIEVSLTVAITFQVN